MDTRDWKPTDLDSGLAVWLDAADTSTTTFDGSGDLSAWEDKSGNSRNAAAIVGSIKATTINSKQALDFINASISLPDFGIAGSQGRAVIAVEHLQSGDVVFALNSQSTSAGERWSFRRLSDNLRVEIASGGYTSGLNDAGLKISAADLDGTTLADVTLYENGVAESATGTNAISTIDAGVKIGRSAGIDYSAGTYAEVVVLDKTWSQSEREKLEGYLAHKWGMQGSLPADHPHKTEAPQVTTGGTFVPWTPEDGTDLPPLAAWLDADDENTVTVNSGDVTQWGDRSDNGISFLPDTNSSPKIRPNEQNGRSIVRSNGVDQGLTESAVLPIIAGSAKRTVFIVAKYSGISGAASLVHLGFDGGNGEVWQVTPEVGVRVRGGNQIFSQTAPNDAFSITVTANSGELTSDISGRINGSVLGVSSTSSETLNTAGAATLFWKGSSNPQWAAGDLAEVVVYETDLSTPVKEKVEGYLAWKWGIQGSLPTNHPYKDQAPGEFVGAGGGQITGTVTVNGSPAVRSIIGITYQPQTITPETGDPFEQRQIVGETISAEDGTYTLSTGDFLEETVVLALEDYGTPWKPNRELAVGDRIRPTQPNQNGYVYEITLAGNSGAEEPTWIIPTGAVTTMDIGTATAQGLPLFWSLAHAPILPESSGPAAPTDQYWANVALYLKFNLADGMSVFDFVDSSDNQLTITPAGNAQLDGNLSVFSGEESGNFNADADYLMLPDTNLLRIGTQDFTIDTWCYFKTSGASKVIYSVGFFGPSEDGFAFYRDPNSKLSVFHESQILAGADNVPQDQWVFCSMDRTAGLVTVYLDGVPQGNVTMSHDVASTDQGYIAAGDYQPPVGSLTVFNGNLDHFRLTIGAARYQGQAFDPPTEPFPTSA